MKSVFIRLILFANFIAGTIPQRLAAAEPPKAEATTGAAICFAQPDYDFGQVIVGVVVKHVFTFTNCGDQFLEINDVTSTCGCTSAGQWSRRVEPGKTGTVAVEFHTDHFNGPVVKPVTVICNVIGHREVTLQLKGEVWHPIDLVPQSAAFSGALETPASLIRTLHITNRETAALWLEKPKSNHHSITGEIITNEPGKSYVLEVNLVPPLGAGNVFGQLDLKTSSTNVPVLSVPVWAVAQPAVMVLPPQVELPPEPLTNQVTRSISVRNNGTTPLELSSLNLTAEGTEATLHELKKGELFTIQLKFPEGFRRPAGHALEVTFKSNNPKFPLLRVPIKSR